MNTDIPVDGVGPEDAYLVETPQRENDPQAVAERREPLQEKETVSLTEKEGENEDDTEFAEMTEDVYSLIFTSRYRSSGLLFCAFVFCFQMAIVALVLWDLLDHFNSDSNVLNVPPGVTSQVKAASALALLLAVATQGDIITALVFFQEGYDPSVLERNPSATRFKWVLAGTCQFVAGGGLLVTIFILVMQSETVIGMMLNFAALSFVSEIDEVAFAMAQNGFLSDSLERQANEVHELRMPIRHTSKVLRRVAFLVLFSGLMVGYGIITHQQRSGKFLCDSIYLQLGDGFYADAPYFSGVYDQTDKLINERVTYIDRRSGQAMLGYCDDENAWTLTFWDSSTPQDERKDPCDFSAQSPKTETFDIMTTADSTWLIEDPGGSRALPLLSFEMLCVDCDEGSDSACSGYGECKDNKCECFEGSFGITCNLFSPCPRLAVDLRTESFPAAFQADILSDEYELLQDNEGTLVTVYEKPVYTFNHFDIFWSIIMFTGRRWIVTSSAFFNAVLPEGVEPLPEKPTSGDVVKFLRNYHGWFTPVFGPYVSDPMDVGTPSDASSPVELGWFRTKQNSASGLVNNEVDQSQPLETVLLCSVCNVLLDNLCFNLGECADDGTCECKGGFDGSLCELELDSAGNFTGN